MEHTKGDRVLFGNGTSLLEGVVQKTYEDDNIIPMLLITNCTGSSFVRPADSVVNCTLNQAKASKDMYEALKSLVEIFEHPTNSVTYIEADKAKDALVKAEGRS